MSTVQLRLLPAPQPLVDRLGEALFRGIPPRPGVYRMYGELDRLLYVGKARDLRARLGSYRRTHGQSRKTIRLIHRIRRIEWEVLPSESEARLRENELLRTLRPPFNRAGTWPAAARYVRLAEVAAGFVIETTRDPDGECYGVFRAGTGQGLAALARLLSMAWTRTARVDRLPHRIRTTDALRRFEATHPAAADWLPEIRAFYAGSDDAVVARLVREVPEADGGFDAAFVARQFEVLLDFLRRGPLRHARLRTWLPPDRRLLTPEEHDDLLVLHQDAWPAPPRPSFPPLVHRADALPDACASNTLKSSTSASPPPPVAMAPMP